MGGLPIPNEKDRHKIAQNRKRYEMNRAARLRFNHSAAQPGASTATAVPNEVLDTSSADTSNAPSSIVVKVVRSSPGVLVIQCEHEDKQYMGVLYAENGASGAPGIISEDMARFRETVNAYVDAPIIDQWTSVIGERFATSGLQLRDRGYMRACGRMVCAGCMQAITENERITRKHYVNAMQRKLQPIPRDTKRVVAQLPPEERAMVDEVGGDESVDEPLSSETPDYSSDASASSVPLQKRNKRKAYVPRGACNVLVPAGVDLFEPEYDPLPGPSSGTAKGLCSVRPSHKVAKKYRALFSAVAARNRRAANLARQSASRESALNSSNREPVKARQSVSHERINSSVRKRSNTEPVKGQENASRGGDSVLNIKTEPVVEDEGSVHNVAGNNGGGGAAAAAVRSFKSDKIRRAFSTEYSIRKTDTDSLHMTLVRQTNEQNAVYHHHPPVAAHPPPPPQIPRDSIQHVGRATVHVREIAPIRVARPSLSVSSTKRISPTYTLSRSVDATVTVRPVTNSYPSPSLPNMVGSSVSGLGKRPCRRQSRPGRVTSTPAISSNNPRNPALPAFGLPSIPPSVTPPLAASSPVSSLHSAPDVNRNVDMSGKSRRASVTTGSVESAPIEGRIDRPPIRIVLKSVKKCETVKRHRSPPPNACDGVAQQPATRSVSDLRFPSAIEKAVLKTRCSVPQRRSDTGCPPMIKATPAKLLKKEYDADDNGNEPRNVKKLHTAQGVLRLSRETKHVVVKIEPEENDDDNGYTTKAAEQISSFKSGETVRPTQGTLRLTKGKREAKQVVVKVEPEENDDSNGCYTTKAAEHSNGFKTGEIVWAKNGMDPYWPGHIYKFVKQNRKNGAFIIWYGGNYSPFIELARIENFVESYAKRFNPKRPDPKYHKAVGSAIIACFPKRGYFEQKMSQQVYRFLSQAQKFDLGEVKIITKRKKRTAGSSASKRRRMTVVVKSEPPEEEDTIPKTGNSETSDDEMHHRETSSSATSGGTVDSKPPGASSSSTIADYKTYVVSKPSSSGFVSKTYLVTKTGAAALGAAIDAASASGDTPPLVIAYDSDEL